MCSYISPYIFHRFEYELAIHIQPVYGRYQCTEVVKHQQCLEYSANLTKHTTCTNITDANLHQFWCANAQIEIEIPINSLKVRINQYRTSKTIFFVIIYIYIFLSNVRLVSLLFYHICLHARIIIMFQFSIGKNIYSESKFCMWHAELTFISKIAHKIIWVG